MHCPSCQSPLELPEVKSVYFGTCSACAQRYKVTRFQYSLQVESVGSGSSSRLGRYLRSRASGAAAVAIFGIQLLLLLLIPGLCLAAHTLIGFLERHIASKYAWAQTHNGPGGADQPHQDSSAELARQKQAEEMAAKLLGEWEAVGYSDVQKLLFGPQTVTVTRRIGLGPHILEESYPYRVSMRPKPVYPSNPKSNPHVEHCPTVEWHLARYQFFFKGQELHLLYSYGFHVPYLTLRRPGQYDPAVEWALRARRLDRTVDPD